MKGSAEATPLKTRQAAAGLLLLPLLAYTAGQPYGATKENLDWILSDAGPCIIQEKEYAPVRLVSCG